MGDSGVASPIVLESQLRLALRYRSRAIGYPLSAIRAAVTAVGGFSLLALLVYVADEHPAFEASTRTL